MIIVKIEFPPKKTTTTPFRRSSNFKLRPSDEVGKTQDNLNYDFLPTRRVREYFK